MRVSHEQISDRHGIAETRDFPAAILHNLTISYHTTHSFVAFVHTVSQKYILTNWLFIFLLIRGFAVRSCSSRKRTVSCRLFSTIAARSLQISCRIVLLPIAARSLQISAKQFNHFYSAEPAISCRIVLLLSQREACEYCYSILFAVVARSLRELAEIILAHN